MKDRIVVQPPLDPSLETFKHGFWVGFMSALFLLGILLSVTARQWSP